MISPPPQLRVCGRELPGRDKQFGGDYFTL